MSTRNLERLFDPRSIAVIGASNKKGSVGYILLRNLIGAEYDGIVFPVNVSAQSVQGIQAYASISQVPRKIDLAVIAVPAKHVPKTVRECGEAGVGGAVIVSSGFREIGAEGRKLETQVTKIAESYGLRIVGPNCLGYIRPALNLNVTFAHVIPPGGRVAFFSQSGALGTAILDWAAANNVGFSAFVSVGSMSDVDFGDLIDYFGHDALTTSIILYVESITDARKFMSAARHFAKSKPIIVVKSGRHARSALAAASHTGAIAGDDTLYSAVFRRAGVVRVDEIEDLFNASEALSRVSSPRGPRLGIVTNAGGPGVMASDRLLSLGGELAELTEDTDAKLAEALPSFAARGNPVDVAGDADAVRYATAAQALMDDPGCDGVLAILTPQAMSDPTATAKALVDVARTHQLKPLLTSFMGEIKVAEAVQVLRTAHVPTFDTPEDAVRAYMYMYQYTRNLANLYETPADILPDFEPDRAAVKTHLPRPPPATAARSSTKSRPSRCSTPTRSRSSRPSSPPRPRSARRRPRRSASPWRSRSSRTRSPTRATSAASPSTCAPPPRPRTSSTRSRRGSRRRAPTRPSSAWRCRPCRAAATRSSSGPRRMTPSDRRSCSAWAAPASSSTATSPSTSRPSTRRWRSR